VADLLHASELGMSSQLIYAEQAHRTARQASVTLTSRQTKVSEIVKALQELGAMVTSPLPLPADQSSLYFTVTEQPEQKCLDMLQGAGWSPKLIKLHPHFDIKSYSVVAASLYELPIPVDRQPVASDKVVGGEIGKTERSKEELAVHKYVRGAQ
jgi:hypothetical protein